jgi:hypothetical protein
MTVLESALEALRQYQQSARREGSGDVTSAPAVGCEKSEISEKRSVERLEEASAAHGVHHVFPHCPRCGSFSLYRKNNIGNYECQTCELGDITEGVARSPHRA